MNPTGVVGGDHFKDHSFDDLASVSHLPGIGLRKSPLPAHGVSSTPTRAAMAGNIRWDSARLPRIKSLNHIMIQYMDLKDLGITSSETVSLSAIATSESP